MNLEAVISHHLLDHAYFPLFTIGGVTFSLTKHLVIMWLVGLFLVLTFGYAANGQSALAKTMRGGLEGIIIYLRDEIIMPILGHHGRPYVHYFLTLFFFILACNLAGLIPGSATATGNIGVTGGLALCSFGLVVIAGIKAQGGVMPFLGHFIPLDHDTHWSIKLLLGPLLFVLELGGLMVKCAVLMLRLFANMIAGHIVILGIMSLIFLFAKVSVGMGLGAGAFSMALITFVNCLELLICLLQAFVFTLLTAVFVGSVMHAH